MSALILAALIAISVIVDNIHVQALATVLLLILTLTLKWSKS